MSFFKMLGKYQNGEAAEKSNSRTKKTSEEARDVKMKKTSAETSRERDGWFESEGQLAVDVYETGEDVIIQSTIAGIKPEDLDITIEQDTVTIRGTRKKPNEEGISNFFYQECYWGPFSRQIIVPEEIDSSRAEATLRDGIFTLKLPKLQGQKTKKILVKKEA